MKLKKNLCRFTIVTAICILSSTLSIAAYNAANNDNAFKSNCTSRTSDNNGQAEFVTMSKRPAFETDFTVAAENTVNGVVSIKNFATPKQRNIQGMQGFNDPMFEFFFGPQFRGGQGQQQQQQPQQTSLGSGVIISADGYIVTNNHVVDGADKLEVTLNDNRSFNATIIGTDASTDLALIKIDAKNLPVVKFGDSENLKVGEWVLAVGNPLGLTSTVTAGIVSAKARSIGTGSNGNKMGIESFIQTDAAVNHGNSGGALVNTNGELVGINTAIYSETGSYAGYSFAIPTSIVSKVITDIKQYGTVQRALLGITYTELTPEFIKSKELSVQEGIYVQEVLDRSSAIEAGIEKGDVITHIDGELIKKGAILQEQMAKHRPGDKVKVTLNRNGKIKELTVTLKNSQGNTQITKKAELLSLGCAFKELSTETRKQLSLKQGSGIQVVGVKDGKFKNAGIKEGFVILEINGTAITSADDVESVFNAIMKGESSQKVMFITGVYPTGAYKYYAVDLSE